MSASLSNRGHLALVLAVLLKRGAICPKCGHGTRVTSKSWAKCKNCGERVQRQDVKAVSLSIPKASRRLLDRLARARLQGFIPISRVNAHSLQALQRRGLVTGYELTNKGWTVWRALSGE